MFNLKHILIISFAVATLATEPVMAGLPASVNGEALPTLAPLVEKTRPAVVNIATRGRTNVQNNPLLNDPFFRRFFQDFGNVPQHRETRSLGSGVVIDAGKGFIVTNHHVVDGADEIQITLYDGKEFAATLVGSDPEADVALLKVDAKNLTEIAMADSDQLRVGDFAVAIGNPFGLGQTVTSGIVSALGRTGLGIEGYEDFIQTDASINPGNSGGALVNLNGDLIGINTAIIAAGGQGNVGIGFAIPINMVRQIVDQLIEFGEVRRGMLGVIMQNLTPELAKAFGLDLNSGVVISKVIEGSAAEEAGVKAGDVVVSINGEPIKSASAMRNAVGMLRVGEKMKMEVIRDDRRKTLTAVIKDQVDESVEGKKVHERLAGATIEQSNEGGEVYLVVTEVEQNSPAWQSSLRKGDIILSVNRKAVKTLEEFKQVVGDKSKQILLNIQRGRSALFILIQ
ncbi:MAG: DegQ family serine endoprotease [Gammaproteobacteria bacterium]|nr:DegQ family serine endoprotease [Gammaproteobacteria bacterium]